METTAPAERRSSTIGQVPLPVIAVALAVAATLLGDSMLYAVMPSQPEAWALSVPAVGILLSANRLVRLLTNSVAAVAFERFGSRAPFTFALALSVVVTLTYGWATAFVVLLIARLAWGTCWSLLRLGGFWAVARAAERLHELVASLAPERVVDLRPVQRDRDDVFVLLIEEILILGLAHRCLPIRAW